ncbi:hypothetical protein ABEF92_001502 [Exophiala dermatitidis]|uniref:HECT-type E3 ubiquitin transferase n=1 Tax=Exophiala dermatitidis (strain ATCC 34100 / CBS 525.76 / NIH/UT8656) TaxID=858893 RepID=H6C2K5_EXODN|nr:ubiquitin-protein ligase E3 A [Exophiala dermatitidis NIH/UT8656]EHY57923.1 ubiquitin-protein ligase E3 A [Exophiala dermatitidis NIH/UT8656]
MHYAKHASRTGSLDDSTHEALDRQSRVKASDLGFDVPDHVLSEIIPISDPRHVYSNIHAQRDRRLRLLIRRYTNQIQYGCRNINCTTPTCLSYRKRNSTGPLRRYTELSARTLACQLVDDYTRSGKDSVSGLCQNEPVVPWYEDPEATKRRRDSLEKAGLQRRESASVAKISSQTLRSKEPPPKPAFSVERLSQDGIVQAGRRLRTLDISKNDEEIAEEITDVLNAIPSNQPASASNEDENKNPCDTASVGPEPPESKPKDIASFTQTLFDLLPLRLLSWLPGGNPRELPEPRGSAEHSTNHQQAYSEDADDCAPDPIEEPPGVTDPSTESLPPAWMLKRPAVQAYTLRKFTWSMFPWLQSRLDDSNNDAYNDKFLPFLKQSLSYCFSDPEHLVRTVRDLQDSSPFSEGFADFLRKELTRSVSKATVKQTGLDDPSQDSSSGSWPRIKTGTADDLYALLDGLALVDGLKQRSVFLNSMFTALQHSYRLPPWLQPRQKRKHSYPAGILTDRSSNRGSQHLNSSGPPPQDLDAVEGLGEACEDEKQLVLLNDDQAAEICLVALAAIASLIFENRGPQAFGGKTAFAEFAALRNTGLAHSRWHKIPRDADRLLVSHIVDLIIQAIDVCDDWSVLRLLTAIMDVISHRLIVAKCASSMKGHDLGKTEKETIVDLLVRRFDRRTVGEWDPPEQRSSWLGAAAIELVRTVMLKIWDCRPIIQRAGPVAGALELLAGIYRERKDLNLDLGSFRMSFIAERFDEMSMPIEWLSFRADTRQMHLLSFSFLFEPATLVRYFRAINIEMMRKSHESAALVYNDTRHYMWAPAIPVYGAREVLASLRPHMAKFFVLTIRRDNVLDDAINQIWRRQRRELMRPLRVRLGKDEGEDGLDHGGVQQEFFRVVFAEAFRPEYGMFTVDARTRMTWFQPGSFEPLYRFEALGVLMSIAVYNGITLPITFPLAFYRKLLGLKVKTLEHIADGWPDLARGLQALLDWDDGDVGDVIARTYEFSYDICGSTVTVDMQKIDRNDPWPPRAAEGGSRSNSIGAVDINGKGKAKAKRKSTSFELPLEPSSLTPPAQPSSPNLLDCEAVSSPGAAISCPCAGPSSSKAPAPASLQGGITTPSSIDSDMLALEEAEAALVTNANREQYVKDYVFWLTHKSIEPQYEAFARGFYTCLDRTALSIFTPETLKSVIEGYQEINIDELERTVTYDDGYSRTSPTIVDFWHVVRSFSQEQHRQLLEFVTASDRVPVNGLANVQFIIQKNGDDDARLPSSSTCYGRLLLPQYSSCQVLEEKLSKAIENSVGFGTL